MTYAECFAGIGGWSVGVRDCNWYLKWQCEFDPKLQRFLSERFGVPIHSDIRTATEAGLSEVDVLIGSPPCQPFSTAGKRGGTGDERHLYPSFIATVRALKPIWVLMEQVPAILSPERDKSGRLTGPAPIGAYIGGLAALGYLGCYHCIPACAVGAPHRRDRIWILAHAGHDARRSEPVQQREVSPEESVGMCSGKLDSDASDSESPTAGRLCGRKTKKISRPEQCNTNAPDSNGQRKSQPQESQQKQRKRTFNSGETASQNGNPTIQGLPDWSGGEVGQPQAITEFERPSGREIERDFCGMAHVVSHRVDRLKGLGNAVVPIIPRLIGQAINEVEGKD